MKERYGVTSFEYYTKDSASIATPEEVMASLVAKCDAVIHAIAD
jgi:hypothetical protein